MGGIPFSLKLKLAIKNAIWKENDDEIMEALKKTEKVQNIVIQKSKKERNYLKRMNLPDARTWFRYRCKTTKNIKGNTSSSFRDNMQCRHCTSGEDETQEHLETCDFTSEMRRNLNLNKEREHMILWRKITKNLRELYKKANLNNKKTSDGHSSTTKVKATQGGRSCRIGQEPQGTSTDSPDDSEETCYIIREGLTQATEAISALDMSVDAVIIRYDPP